jgi:SlyX protein
MSEQRIQMLEEKLAFIEMANLELEEEIFRQQQEIEVLTKAHQKLLQRLDMLENGVDQGDQSDNSPPPHY